MYLQWQCLFFKLPDLWQFIQGEDLDFVVLNEHNSGVPDVSLKNTIKNRI